VGAQGRVYAIDVDEDMLEHLRARAAEEGVTNVEPLRARPEDPGLPPASVDLIFVCNTYHHLPDREAYFARAAAALRPGGRVAVVEYQPEGLFQRIFHHATAEESILEEMRAAGFRLVRDHAFLERQSFLIFAVADAG
jgi:ubiquinone/menaquinone biosynthesis C-methylase UbiE